MSVTGLLKEDNVIERANELLERCFGKDVKMENLPRRICYVSLDNPPIPNTTEVVSCWIIEVKAILGEGSFSLFVRLENNFLIQLPVVDYQDFSKGLENLLDVNELVDFVNLKYCGWLKCLVLEPTQTKKTKRKNWNLKLDPIFNAKIKIL